MDEEDMRRAERAAAQLIAAQREREESARRAREQAEKDSQGEGK